MLAQDEGEDKADAAGTPQQLGLALARVAALMDRNEDALVLYTTSHGTPSAGINYKDAVRGTGVITPPQFAAMLDQHRFENRLIILQACFSGQFIPALSAPGTVVATAASALTLVVRMPSGQRLDVLRRRFGQPRDAASPTASPASSGARS